MRLTQLSLLALASKVVHGYIDTSPFFMFSTTEYVVAPPDSSSIPQLTILCRLLLPTNQVQSGSKLTSDLISTLSRCPSDIYVLINQASVGASDFSTPTSAPTLSKFLSRAAHPTLRSSIIIPEVAGGVDVQLLRQELDSKCGAWSTAIDASGIQIMSTRMMPPNFLQQQAR